jgi:hypothetical protein
MRFETSDVTRLTIGSTGIATFSCQIQTNGGCVTVNKGDGTPAVLQLGNSQNSFQIQFTCTGGQRLAFINGAPTEFASFYGTGISCFLGTVCAPSLSIRNDSSNTAAFTEIATCWQNAYRYVSINAGSGIEYCIPGGTSQSPYIQVQGGSLGDGGGSFKIRTGAMGSVSDKLNIFQNGVACFASNVCANSLTTIGGGLNENFNATGGGHVNRYFAVKYIPENTTQAFFRITTSGASSTQVHLAGSNSGVGWHSGQIYLASNTAYWGGWIGSGTSVSITSTAAGYISGVYSDGAGGQNYCVSVANNGTGTSSLIWAYITTITYAGYSTSFTQL